MPTYGPVPVLPENIFATSYEQYNPYAYDVDKAKSLLSDHGWDVKSNGTSTCSDASKCSVPAGTPLDFTIQYVNNGPAEEELMNAQKSSWAQAGINVTLSSGELRRRDRQRDHLPRLRLHVGDGELGRRLGLLPRLLPVR